MKFISKENDQAGRTASQPLRQIVDWCQKHQLMIDDIKDRLRLGRTLLGLGLLRQEHRVDVGEHTTGSDSHTAKQLVQLLIVANSKLDVARNDASLLVVASSIAGQLKNLSGKVLEHSAEVDWSASTDAGSVLAALQIAMHTTNRELQTSLLRPRDGLATLGLAATSRAFACLAGHDSFRCWAWPFRVFI
jgi:hypothetical protein